MSVSKLNEKTKVKVINNTRGSLSFMGCDDKKYLFPTPNSYKTIMLEIIEALYSDYPQMVLEGYLIFEDRKVYDYLEIPEEDSKKIVPKEFLKDILEQNADELSETLETLPKQIQENLATLAKETKVDSIKKVKAIKDKTGFDVSADLE